jgi:5-methylcytosine-specific restriction protein A
MPWPKTSRHARGYGSAWTKLRTQIWSRDSGICQPCLRMAPPRTTIGTDVHHIRAKADHGSDDPSNLEVVCRTCHERLTAEAQGHTVKRRYRVALDGTMVEC